MHIVVRILLLIATIGVLIGAYVLFDKVRNQGCIEHPPTWTELNEGGLNSDYAFISDQYRNMAEIIYEYRKSKEYQKVDLGHGVIFTSINPKATIPSATHLKDVALHKLATCDSSTFNRYINYIPFFNHPRYVECLKAYKESDKAFAENARGTIINEILKINPDPVSDSVGQALQKQIPEYVDADLYKVLTDGLP